jgi:hypothetical protein
MFVVNNNLAAGQGYGSDNPINVTAYPNHSHTISDPGHVHGVSDPGHNHLAGAIVYNIPSIGGSQTVSSPRAYPSTQNPTTSSSGTGIGINLNGTNIQVNQSGGGFNPLYLNFIVCRKN